MADLDFDDFEGGYRASNGRAARWVNLAGAACSVALALGVVVWGYKLAVRDVSGIPVVRALEGPLRISPENPGGDVALHQGLSVNAVAAVGVAAPLPETVKLAPSEAELAAEDSAGVAVLANVPARLPVEGLTEVSVNVATPVGISLKPLEVAVQPVELPEPSDIAVEEPVPATQQDAVAAALAIALADDGTTETTQDAIPAAVKSLRPKARPARDSSIASIMPEVAATSIAEMASDSIPVGARLVQLGAFDDEAGARVEWTKLQERFPELMAAKAMVVQPAQSGGRTFYRLRAHGFQDEVDTRTFCSALLIENASCIAVLQR